MQVNTRAAHDAATARMTGLSAQVDKLNTMIATRRRIVTADEDPVGAARALQIGRTLATTASQRTGIDRATSRLNSSDAALTGVSTLLQRAKEIALLGGNATLNADDRATLAAEAGQLSEQLLGYANARDSDGAVLFAGARTGSAAYAADAGGAVVWHGAGSAAVLALDDGVIPTGVDGPQVFEGLPGAAGPTDAFAMLRDLAAALVEPDALRRTAALATVQTTIDASISRTADTLATVGTRLVRLDTEGQRLDAATTALEADGVATEGLDDAAYAAAIARLQRLSTVLQAAQLSFVKVSSLNLWDFLR